MTENEMKFDVRTEQRSGLLSAILGKLDSLAPALTDADFPASVSVPNPQLCGWEFLNATTLKAMGFELSLVHVCPAVVQHEVVL